MSKTSLKQPNFSENQLPSFPRFNSTLLFINTNKNIEPNNSFPYLEQPQAQQEQVSIEAMLRNTPQTRRRKVGCTCKKTNCIKMYCECFSSGKMCTPQCACYGCYNLEEYQEIVHQAKQQCKIKVKPTHKGCHCKKTSCQKKYCQCYNLGLSCGQNCKCTNCSNKEPIKQDQIDNLSELYQ